MYKLEKAIENDKVDIHMAMEKVKKLKEKITHSLKRRKELAIQMNENMYIEERIEDLCRDFLYRKSRCNHSVGYN